MSYYDEVDYAMATLDADEKANGVNAVLGEVLHDIGVWGIENKIPVTKTDKLKEVIVKHFT